MCACKCPHAVWGACGEQKLEDPLELESQAAVSGSELSSDPLEEQQELLFSKAFPVAELSPRPALPFFT